MPQAVQHHRKAAAAWKLTPTSEPPTILHAIKKNLVSTLIYLITERLQLRATGLLLCTREANQLWVSVVIVHDVNSCTLVVQAQAPGLQDSCDSKGL